MTQLKTFTREEVSRHATEDDLWIIIDGAVYDVSEFVDLHPGTTWVQWVTWQGIERNVCFETTGGVFPIMELAGKDATDAFYGLHRQEVLIKYDRLKIGTIAGEEPQISIRQPGEISRVPYAESSAWMGYKSPYFK